jgi:GntP family gluconate:H+ symporter
MVAGLSAAHGFVPPHPGPLAAIEFLKADMGKTILYSLPIALVSGIFAGPLFTKLIRLPQAEIPSEFASTQKHSVSFSLALFVVLLPILLMTLSTIAEVLAAKGTLVKRSLDLVGSPIIALLIGVLFAYLSLGRRFSKQELLRFSEESLSPVAIILLVIGAGAGFSRVLIESGVGKAIADVAINWRLPALPMGYLLAALIRIATGSATVAITTSAALVKPIADAQPGTNLELLVLAMGAGSLILSHVNDGGFWLAKSYLNLSVPDTLKTWTILETILSVVGFACVLILNAVF